MVLRRAADLTVFPKRFTDGSKPFSNRKPLKPFNGLTVQTENGLTVLTENRSNRKPFETVQAVFNENLVL